jgi:Atypical PilZ domain, cyclic di-GMP receptor
MGDAFFGEGLVFDDTLPIAFVAGTPPDEAQLARINADNRQLLSEDASLEDTHRVEVLKEESMALVQELRRLEFKLDAVLRLLASMHMRDESTPRPQKVRFTASALEWFGEGAPASGAIGVIELYLNRGLPQPLRLPAVAVATRTDAGTPVTQMQFENLSEIVKELIERFIFRHHRRLIAGSKHAYS